MWSKALIVRILDAVHSVTRFHDQLSNKFLQAPASTTYSLQGTFGNQKNHHSFVLQYLVCRPLARHLLRDDSQYLLRPCCNIGVHRPYVLNLCLGQEIACSPRSCMFPSTYCFKTKKARELVSKMRHVLLSGVSIR